jgi:hypothetical protein
VFSDCTKDLDNAVLLELVQLYINDEKYEEVKSNIDQVVSRLNYEFYSMKPSAVQAFNMIFFCNFVDRKYQTKMQYNMLKLNGP